MFQRKLKPFLAAILAAGTMLSPHAQMAQDPLLSRTAAVEPNIVFMFDDSGSMPATAVYQYGGSAGGLGLTGPGNDSISEMLSPPTSYYGRSPDVNLIYYDPRVTYSSRVNADGTFQPTPTLANSTTFRVYFYKPASSSVYSVRDVSVTAKGSGYPASGITALFSAPPAGGVRATGTVTTAPSTRVNSVTITSGGTGYPSSGVSATFSAPPAGGVRATGTVAVTAVSTGRISTTISINNSGRNYTSPPTVTFSAPQGSGGVRATGTANINWQGRVTGITVTNPGSGYTTAPTITFSGGGGRNASATATLVMSNRISGITITNGGAGYTSTPTLTLGGTGSGTGAAWTVNTSTTNVISAITVTNGGSGYTTPPTLTLSGTAPGTGATWAVNNNTTTTGGINETWRGTGTPTSSTDYFTPAYTPDNGSPLAAGALSVAYPNQASSATASYPKFINRTDCGDSTTTVCTWAQERNNYSNWKTYHSTRLELAKTGIGLAFQPLNPTFRLGWGTINTLDDSNRLDKGVRLYTSRQPEDVVPSVQEEFLTWLYGLTANGSTPNRTALNKVGQYYQRHDSGGPWANVPAGSNALTSSGSEQAGHATCRRSYAMLMTDGYYNDSFTISDQDTKNGPQITEPTSYRYTPIGPYSDTRDGTARSDTFADVAMKYWLTDLRPNLKNGVRSIPGDEAYWQHLNFYAIGLGINGTLDINNPATLRGLTGDTYTAPFRTADWPTPARDHPRSIDDMFHATVNGRGKLLNAKTASELNRSILQMMSDIGGKEGTQSGVAVSTASLTRDTKKYTPAYTPISWSGNVTAHNLDESTGNEVGISWQVETLISTDLQTGAKTYSSLIPPHATRKIYVGNGATSGSTRAVPFTYSAMTSASLTTAMTGTVNAALIDFLRGDASNEDSSASTTSTTAIYRSRETRLGDIVNSTPVFVKDTLDMRYNLLPATVAGQSSYSDFINAKKLRPEGVLFVGANDGMLHAFRDGLYDADGAVLSPGGIEVFAYVPNALLPSLNQLASKTYSHRFYVDGPNVETDAYFTSGTPRWANVVLGTTGAGAGVASVAGVSSPRTAVYAIDVTSLNSGPTTLNASSVLWEVSSTNTSFSELGYLLTDVQAGPTLDGQWVAIFGNGYESKSCQASLFVVNLETGALIREIKTNRGDCTTAKNGLGGVRIVRNANQQIIGVYAGDLLGNLWKFSLNDANTANWKVDLGGVPLFTAGATQPITASPAALTLPLVRTPDPSVGYMVVAGTGKFFEVADISNNAQQSIYGIWDAVAFGAASIPAGSALTSTSLLVQQTITPPVVGPNGNTYFGISNNPVSYTGTTPQRGWFINLPNTGQRLVYPLDVLAGRVTVADTISPANVSLDPCSNTTGGTGYLYLFDALSGGGPTVPLLDTNGDGTINIDDMLPGGISPVGLEGSADGRNVTLKVGEGDRDVETGADQTFVNVSGGAPGGTLITIPCSVTNTCNVPAAERIKSREWRQLFIR